MANKHIRNSYFIPVINHDWREKIVAIKNKTMSTRYPHLASESKMMRLAYKSGK
jgi:hypothetical protein